MGVLAPCRFSEYGQAIWNTRRKVGVPETGSGFSGHVPQSGWVTADARHLRVVADELASAVRRCLETVKAMFGGESSGLAVGPKRYLFSGSLKEAVCGGSVALVSGRGRRGADRCKCSLHRQRSDTVCTNNCLVRRDELEESLLRGIRESVLRPEVVDYAIGHMKRALRQKLDGLETQLQRVRERKRQVELEIARLVQAIAKGQPSHSVMPAIRERERELRAITYKLLEPRPDSLRATLDERRTLAFRD